jgi:hypothetical protein
MKKTLLLVLVFAYSFVSNLQSQSLRTPRIASPEQISRRLGNLSSDPKGPSSAVASIPKPVVSGAPHNGKVTSLSPVSMGSSGNALAIFRCEQNQVVAVDSLDLVAFIHRNNPANFGGTVYHLRYDVSVNGGTTFGTDIGPLNPMLTMNARRPNISLLNLSGTTNPLNSQVVHLSGVQGTSGSALMGGMTNVTTSGSAPTTENYLFQLTNNYQHLPGGLCQSNPGIFWATDFVDPSGKVVIYRGEYSSLVQDVVWRREDSLAPSYSLSWNGLPQMIGPNIAFSPDGMTGWVAWLGDLTGGPDSTLLPIFSKSTDCGQTWSAPFEVNINNVPWIKDSLQTLWVDSTGNPASNGRATCSFDYDLTVDVNGNPHLGVVIGSGIEYTIFSGLAKFLGDVTTPNGGATWDVTYLSPVLAFRTDLFGTISTIAMDNFVQVARDEGGCNIFFSWVDSDTSYVTGSQQGIGFGNSTNQKPNLRIMAKNVNVGLMTYPKLISDSDPLWDGKILFPMMAPIVMQGPNGWELPIVSIEMTANDPMQETHYWYQGNDATLPNAGWCVPNLMQLSWNYFGTSTFVNPCGTTGVPDCSTAVASPCAGVGIGRPMVAGVTLGEAYPNPSNGETAIAFALPATAEVGLTLFNSLGQCVRVVANGEFSSGEHVVHFSTADLAAGLYTCRMQVGEVQLGRKVIVTH